MHSSRLPMKVFHNAKDIHTWLSAQSAKKSIGFVPTMGALHEGHLSLIDAAKSDNDLVVCSIFVNPTQFNDPKDLEKYPRTVEEDLHLLLQRHCDVLFLPEVEDIYSDPSFKERTYDLGQLEARWEGSDRPGHFQGVCMVVQRLLEIVTTDRLYLGQKDFQQFMVLRHMVHNLLQWPIDVIPCPIVREPDGLAMSSRNRRLSAQERKDSLVLSEALQIIKDQLPNSSIHEALQNAKRHLESASSLQKIDYVAVVDPTDLAPVSDFQDSDIILAIVAAHFPSARLIDNWVVKGSLHQ